MLLTALLRSLPVAKQLARSALNRQALNSKVSRACPEPSGADRIFCTMPLARVPCDDDNGGDDALAGDGDGDGDV